MSRFARYEPFPDLSAGACRTPAAAEVFRDITPTTVPQAVTICTTCPAATRAACLEWGIRHEDSNIWGGLGKDGLRRLRRERGIRIVIVRVGEVAPRAKYKKVEAAS